MGRAEVVDAMFGTRFARPLAVTWPRCGDCSARSQHCPVSPADPLRRVRRAPRSGAGAARRRRRPGRGIQRCGSRNRRPRPRPRGCCPAARRRTRPRAGQPAAADHPIHDAAAAGDIARVRALLDAEPGLVHLSDRSGSTPLHRAVAASRARRPASCSIVAPTSTHCTAPAHARSAAMPPSTSSPSTWHSGTGRSGAFAATSRRPGCCCARGRLRPGDRGCARRARAARAILDQDPARIAEARPSGKRAYPRPSSSDTMTSSDCFWTAAPTRTGRTGPTPPEASRCTRRRAGDTQVVEWLLAAGADPNSYLDSAGNATYVASTPELRAFDQARRRARPL